MPDSGVPVAVPSKTELTKLASNNADLGEFLGRMVNLNDAGVFHEPKCQICRSTHRRQAEQEWLTSRDAEQIRQSFIDKGETYSIPVVKNHMEFHLDQSQVELRKREYIDRVLALSRNPVTTLDRLEVALAAVQERLVSASALEDPCAAASVVEKIKSDATCKLTATMSVLLKFRAEMLGELRQNGEVFTVNKQAFGQLFGKLLSECVTDEEKLVVNKVFGELQKVCREY
jgi:hypothetical protein